MIRWIRRLLPRHASYQSEIHEEIIFHIEERTRALMAQGVDPAAAKRQAEQEFGNVATAREELAEIDRRQAATEDARAWRTDLAGDFRQGFRVFRRSPGFSLLLLAILALAIGANSASFTVLRAALVKGLPYAQPEQLVHLWETTPEGGDAGGEVHRTEASWPDFADWREQSTVFERLEGYDQTNLAIASSSGVTMRQGSYVTPGFFALLGVRPILGRDFTAEDDIPGGPAITLISYGLWQNRFGGSVAVLDSSLVLDGVSTRIVGVLPAGFHFAPIGDAEVWMPMDPSEGRRELRFNHWIRVIGRLKPGASVERAQAEMSQIMGRLATEYAETNQGRDAVVIPLRDELLGKVQPVLVALFVAMGLVLLIACANIAGLLLARAIGREQEIQVRAALGASRWRIARQLIVESLIFAVLGGILGTVLGQAGMRWVLTELPQGLLDRLPALQASRLDGAVLGYTALIAAVTGIGFGLGPIVHALGTNRSVTASIRTTGHRGMRRLRDALIIGEIALTLVLLAGTALVGRSLFSLLTQELGFRTEQIYTTRIALGGPAYDDPAVPRRFFAQLVSQVSEIPEVRSVGAVSQLPLNGGGTSTLHLEGTEEKPAAERPEATTREVAGDYFQTMGIPLVRGRLFASTDDWSAPRAMLVSETLAQILDPAGDVLGRSVRFHAFPQITWEIVGVVADVRTGALDAAPPPTLYFHLPQSFQNRMSLVIRTALPDARLAELVRDLVTSLDPSVPVYASGKLSAVVSDAPAVAARRVPFVLLSIFAGSALILAIVGLYGVVSYSVASRTRELGIRMALGAAPSQIRWSVLRYGSMLAVMGTLLGIVIAMGLSGMLRDLLFGVGPLDLVAYGGAALLLVLVTVVASLVPAHRATRVDPAITLRE
jgi:predicted permease